MTDLIKRDDALLPCPFCGGDKNIICRTDYDGRDAYAVSCRYPECHGAIFTLGYGYFADKAEAIAAWNTRALPAVTVGVKPLNQFGVRELARAAGISPTTAMRVKRGEGDLDGATLRAVLAATGTCLCCGRQPQPIDPAAIREAALREAAEVAQRGADILGGRMRDAKDKKEKRDWQSMLLAAVDIKDAILALIGEKE